MPIPTNANFDRMVEELKVMGPEAKERVSDTDLYKSFIAEFPLDRLPTLSADEYCVGKKSKHSFGWWIERGLEPVMGRYMPGTARGHILYFEPDGHMYKHRDLVSLSDLDALAYTLKVQHAIASASPDDMEWVDDDDAIYARVGVAPRVTVGNGRKLRLLACYHPEEVMLTSSSDHVGHFLKALGMPEEGIPEKKRPVARMLALRQYFLLARESVPGLSTRGFMRALYSDALGIAPVKRKEDWDDEAEDDDLAASAYLLTWNPENFKLGGDNGVKVGEEQRWTCNSKRPEPGDAVYLVRLGQEPRGMVARGIVTQGSFEEPHWRDASKTARYIRFRVEEFRPDAASGLLPMVLLNTAMPGQKWSPQSSGIAIPEPAATQLRKLWDDGATTHSLRQFVDWETLQRRADHAPWLKGYQATTEMAQSLRENPGALDVEKLRTLWSRKNNGVSDVGSGTMSGEDFSANQELLRELTRDILSKPDSSTMQAVEKRWRAAVEQKKMSKVNFVVIRRVFAATIPDAATSLLQPVACQKLLKLLREQFQLVPPAESGPDWLGLNADIAACMRLGGLDPARPLQNNIAMWELVKDRTTPAPDEEFVVQEPSPRYEARIVNHSEPKNLVLYGPPGTGKTYATVKEAVRIVAPELLEGEISREVLKARFDEFVESGQIVFTTFHQSYSYEDFVEGLRAGSKQGVLEYTVEPGVFKRLCERAARGRVAAEDPFDKALKVLRTKMEDSDDGRLKMSTSRGKVFHASYDGGDTFRVFPAASNETLKEGYTASMRQVRELFAGADEQGMYNTPYVRGMLAYLQASCGLATTPEGPDAGENKPFVLIIDEINRGSVSRIFGELITLIEPSKRAGLAEALEVILPYSKTAFSVPANLHIIATMNTADRSLAGMDIALRRRFDFIEMPPRPEELDAVFVGDLCIGQLLRVMNERIELVLDREHCLGHASFMPLKKDPSLHRLAGIFRTGVLPLLQEYFFEDWQRIQWVLNDHRKPDALRFIAKPKTNLDLLFGEGVAVNEQSQRWVVNEAAFDNIEAFAAVVSAQGVFTP